MDLSQQARMYVCIKVVFDVFFRAQGRMIEDNNSQRRKWRLIALEFLGAEVIPLPRPAKGRVDCVHLWLICICEVAQVSCYSVKTLGFAEILQEL